MKKIEIEELNNNIEKYIINNLTEEEVEKYNLLKSKFLIYPHIYIINYRTGGHSICHSNTSFSKVYATYAESIEHFKNRIVDSVKNYINSINYNIYNKEV